MSPPFPRRRSGYRLFLAGGRGKRDEDYGEGGESDEDLGGEEKIKDSMGGIMKAWFLLMWRQKVSDWHKK